MNFDTVIPVLVYRDIERAHAFLVKVFQFEPGQLHRAPDGKVVHGEVRIGGTTVWLHRETAEHSLSSPKAVGMASQGLVIRVEDVDAHFQHASSSGATIDFKPVDRPYGQREYGVRDSEGHRWWFAAPLMVTA